MFKKSENCNPNYLAKIIKLSKPVKHPNADKLLGWIIDGSLVWTDNVNYKEGDIVVYFPLECQINPLILSQLNLYSNTELNTDKTKKGFFSDTGRVKAIKLRGEPSEGFILKTQTFLQGIHHLMSEEAEFNYRINKFTEYLDYEFDIYEDTWVCKKYIPKTQGKTVFQKQSQKVKDILVEGQFKFHYDTEQLKRNIHKIEPTDLITISKKYHGTSGVSANVLVKKDWHEIIKFFNTSFTVENCFFSFWLFLSLISFRILPIYLNFYWLVFPHFAAMIFNKKYRNFMRQPIGYLPETEHKDICSSRRVIKSVGEEKRNSNHYYKFDIWKHCHDIIKPSLEKGITLYYEIVGYLPNGTMIQKDYDYGCIQPNTPILSGQPTQLVNMDTVDVNAYYREGNHFKILVYRITYTTPEGKVIEFSWQQIKQYCQRYGLNMPKTYYEGKVIDCFNSHDILPLRNINYTTGFSEEAKDSFSERLLNGLSELYLEQEDEECNHKVPDEGIVIRIENGKSLAYKLKSFAFLEKESKDLDSEQIDIETEQSENE